MIQPSLLSPEAWARISPDTAMLLVGRNRSQQWYLEMRRWTCLHILIRGRRHATEVVGAQSLGSSACQAQRLEEGKDRCRTQAGVIMHRMWVDGASFRWAATAPEAFH